MRHVVKLATRASKLALAQASIVESAILELFANQKIPSIVEIVPVQTSGDLYCDRPLKEIGGKALFVREIDNLLLSGHVDLAVHSAKDMPTDISEPALTIAATMTREDPRDVMITRGSLHNGDYSLTFDRDFKIGTSSPRRKAMILNRHPNATLIDLRGNVDSRINKLMAGEVDAILLAVAGLKRISLNPEKIGKIEEIENMIPAGGQGVIAVQCRTNDQGMRDILHGISDEDTMIALNMERCFLSAIGASCYSAVGVFAKCQPGQQISFIARFYHEESYEYTEVVRTGNRSDANMMALSAAEEMLAKSMSLPFLSYK